MIHQPILVFDIETIPDISSLKKVFKIEKKFNDDEVVSIAKYFYRQNRGNDFLPHQFQQIVAISCVLRTKDDVDIWTLGNEDSTESDMLERFFDGLNKYTPVLVSWNGNGFDLPVINYRSLFNAIEGGIYFDQGEQNNDFKFNNYINRYHQRHVDLMDTLAIFSGRANASLDNIAKLSGFPGKLEMDGSDVYENFKAGNLIDIRNYCETDVANTYLVYLKFLLFKNQITKQDYVMELDKFKSKILEMNLKHFNEFVAAWDKAEI
ncbi:MAG: 3'-5' exonuclease [Nitrosomonadales bacterium]